MSAYARGKDRMQWWYHAATMAVLANCNRDSKKHSRPFRPQDFHPYEQRRVTFDTELLAAVIGGYVPPEKLRQSEDKLRREQQQARQLADRMRPRLRVVAA